MKIQSIRAQYMDFIPGNLEDGVLYVSRRFRTASHLCCCGCRTKIVTPLRETEFRLEQRGDVVSLFPSIGNWNHPCQSHYWIRDGRIILAGKMTTAQIQQGRAYDDRLKAKYFTDRTWPWWRRAISRIKEQMRVWLR